MLCMNMTDVILYYDTGFPTRLKNHHRLAKMIERDGPPTTIDGFNLIWYKGADKYGASWNYYLKNPWPGDKRKLIKVALA